MNPLQTALVALRAILGNKLRALLTILGIVIGVAAVIVMVTLGNGVTESVTGQIASLGSNLLTVMPGSKVMCGARHSMRSNPTRASSASISDCAGTWSEPSNFQARRSTPLVMSKRPSDNS